MSLFLSRSADGQMVTIVDRQKEANVKIFETPYKMNADVIVFKTPYVENSVGNRGMWYFTHVMGEANKKIYFIKHREEADLVVYFTDKSQEAGWKNRKKKYIMN